VGAVSPVDGRGGIGGPLPKALGEGATARAKERRPFVLAARKMPGGVTREGREHRRQWRKVGFIFLLEKGRPAAQGVKKETVLSEASEDSCCTAI